MFAENFKKKIQSEPPVFPDWVIEEVNEREPEAEKHMEQGVK